MAATRHLTQLLPEDVIRFILEFVVGSHWQVLDDGVELGSVVEYVEGTCRLFRKMCWELRWRLEYPDGKVLLNARSPKLRLLKYWFGSGLRSLVISVAGADSVQDDIDSMQHNLLGGANLVEAFPGLKSFALSACAGEPKAAESVEADDIELLDNLDEVQNEDYPGLIGQCRYDLDHLGDLPRGAVLVVDRFPLPNRISPGFESVEMHNIHDPADCNLESLKLSGVKSFSIFPVTPKKRRHDVAIFFEMPNGMTADHLAMLPDCLERLALIKSFRFDCWFAPVQWPQCLTVLELSKLSWPSAAPSLPPRLKSLVVRGSIDLKAFDLSWLPHTLESLYVDKPLREMGPFPPQLKFMSMFAAVEAIEGPERPLPDDPDDIRALANEFLERQGPRLRELVQAASPRLLAQSAIQFQKNFTYNAFVLDLDKLPSSLEVLQLTGIRREGVSDRFHVSGHFERLMHLREVRSEHQGVLDYLKEQGKPCTTHLKFVCGRQVLMM